MSLFMIEFIKKIVTFSFVSLISIFNNYKYNEFSLIVTNSNLLKDTSVKTDVLNYDTLYTYSYNRPYNLVRTITEGQDGLSYYNGEEEVLLQSKVNKVVDIGVGKQGKYVGRLTGYGYDCIGCHPEAYVSCKTKEGKPFSLIHDGIYYNDSEYGNLRILAASYYFTCGTIVEVKKGTLSYLAIVLDRGSDMINAWKNGIVWMDLAYESESVVKYDAKNLGYGVEYNVQRWGW